MTRKKAAATFLVTFLLSGVTYLITLAPDLTWANGGGDGGELITAAVTLGVPHPPGYPTYVLLGKAFSTLPWGTIAYRFNLFSAVCMALAAAFVALTAGRLLVEMKDGEALPLTSIATGLCFAFAPLVWGQALIAEVYGLQLALVAACLWALFTRKPAMLTGFLLGLAITGHLTSLFLLPLLLLLAPRTDWWRLAAGMVVGLLPFLVLPFLAQGTSPVVWGTAATGKGWWWVVSGRLYHPNAFSLPSEQLGPRLQEWSVLILSQFTWAGIFLVGLGANRLRHVDSWRHLPAALAATTAIIVSYALGYHTADAAVLLLPALLLLSLFLAPAMDQLRPWSLILPIALLLLNFHGQNLRQETSLRPAATQLLAAAPARSILITPGDASIFALWYFQHVEQQREDLILIDGNLFGFDWYRQRLGQRYPQLRNLRSGDLSEFVHHNEPIYPVRFVNIPEETAFPTGD